MVRRLNTEQRQDALDRFERATELPLLVLAVGMIPLLIVPLVVDLPESVEATFVGLDWFIWAVFAAQFAVRWWLTPEHKGRFVLHEWPDVLIIVVPFLRPLRIMRSARALRLLSLTRLVGVFGEIGQQSKRLLTAHKLHLALLVTMGLVVGAAALVLHAEEGNGGSIASFGTALWWAITTVTTVGYGDTTPITPAGRGIAAFLMVLGIAFFGMLTANLAAYFIEVDTAADEVDATTAAKLDTVLARIDELERRIIELGGHLPA